MALHNNRSFVGEMPLQISWLLKVVAVFTFFGPLASAAEFSVAQQLFFSGKYDDCRRLAQAEVDRGVWNEKWPDILLRCLLTTGDYAQAEDVYQAAIARFKNSIALRMIGHDVYNHVDKPDLARRQYAEIVSLVQRSAWRYSSSSDRLVLGRFLLKQGEDARDVLELAYDRARKSNPNSPDAYIATAELALEKHDYQEAAISLEQAVKLQPDNPDIHLLIAKAWKPSDPERATLAITHALRLNPQHVRSLLFQVDHLIDGEEYERAQDLLTQVLAVNLRHAEAWAYHAVIAHLQGHSAGEHALRGAAFSAWSTNPFVDHLIGRKLSRNYRFAEGARYQRLALKSDPGYLPAKLQLSQDLLRLGKEDEGWQLVSEVHETDGYNVVAYNAVTLRDEMRKYATLETDRFIVRMDARESRIFGPEVLALLNEAYDFMSSKYEVTLDGPVTVDIFPRQKDFAIRTFGLPGGAGFLGVCFGRVITANSPSSQGERPANWRSVLWHEFCHVMTLEKTRNRMPRWLSEGISTYEEQEKNESWGERLTPLYRDLINSDDLTPVSQLSAAFLNPKSPQHLQFAYYESSLVVRYVIEKYGLDMLKRVLTDLSIGMPINESLTRYVGSLGQLDHDFTRYAREYVASIGPEVDWSRTEEVAKMSLNDVKRWLTEHPRNYQALRRYAKLAIEAEDYVEAEVALLELRELCPKDREISGTLALLGVLYRKTNRSQKELEILDELAQLNDRALDVYERLMELHSAEENWEAVRQNALRYLSVQPMHPVGHEWLAESAEHVNRPKELASALSSLLEMDPVDPAELHFRVAKARQASGDRVQAKRQVLKALEQAPRYRDAQRLLLELVEPSRESNPPIDASAATAP